MLYRYSKACCLNRIFNLSFLGVVGEFGKCELDYVWLFSFQIGAFVEEFSFLLIYNFRNDIFRFLICNGYRTSHGCWLFGFIIRIIRIRFSFLNLNLLFMIYWNMRWWITLAQLNLVSQKWMCWRIHGKGYDVAALSEFWLWNSCITLYWRKWGLVSRSFRWELSHIVRQFRMRQWSIIRVYII